MAISFREMPWYVQVLVFVTLCAIIIGLGEWLPFSPVQKSRNELVQLNQDQATLSTQVNALEVYRRRFSEFKAETEAMQKQLDTLTVIVPEEKNLDDFIRMVQSAAASAGVEIRDLSAGTVAAKQYHYEMPFDIEIDGPYYGILDFFSRLSRLSRIINVGDLTIGGLPVGGKVKIPQRPGTSVTGKLTLTTYFSNPADTGAAGKNPPPGAVKH
jgi:type IV pilus assembly protein PilO